MSDDPRLDYPATARNREFIRDVLREVLPARGTVLEIASGSGQHAAFFASTFSHLRWQPSDLDADLFASIRAWSEGLDNVAEPVAIDVTAKRWPIDTVEAGYCANMIHIAPWEACLGLLDGMSRVLRPGAPLCLYGPFMRGGEHTAPSNAAFDADLRRRNPEWGVRDREAVIALAEAVGFVLREANALPANNQLLVFERMAG